LWARQPEAAHSPEGGHQEWLAFSLRLDTFNDVSTANSAWRQSGGGFAGYPTSLPSAMAYFFVYQTSFNPS